MVAVRCAVALAARAHDRGGRASTSSDAFGALRTAVADLGREHTGLVSGPSAVVRDSVVVVPLASPAAVLTAVLALASGLRPMKTTFCAAVLPVDSGGGKHETDTVDAALLAADRAATAAAAGIADTDPRDTRVLVMAPEPDVVLGALLDLLLEAHEAMTDRQRQIVELIRVSETQQQVASHLGISRQAVNQSLTAVHWHHLERAEDAARQRLDSLPPPRDAGTLR